MSANKICRTKFSQLYTSFERMEGEKHLKAIFAMNVSCSMNEILKFPGFFDMNDLNEYLESIQINSLIKDRRAKRTNINYVYGGDYLIEEKLSPASIAISGVEDGIVYFSFDQHFKNYEIRKYKVKVSVKDFSIQRAKEAHDALILALNFLRQKTQAITSEREIQYIQNVIFSAVKITNKVHDIYDRALQQSSLEPSLVRELTEKLSKDMTTLRRRLRLPSRFEERGNDLKRRPETTGLNAFTTFEHTFNQEVKFDFKSEYNKTSSNVSIEQDSVQYIRTLTAKVKPVSKLPELNGSYSKKYSFDQKQTMEERAENYNLGFVDPRDTMSKNSITLIERSVIEPIYVLLGHNNNLVNSPNFMLLSESRQNLDLNSSYLCKTSMVEAEDQYFILET